MEALPVWKKRKMSSRIWWLLCELVHEWTQCRINRIKTSDNCFTVEPKMQQGEVSVFQCTYHTLHWGSLQILCLIFVTVCSDAVRHPLGLAVSSPVCRTVSASASVPLAAPGSPQKTRRLQVRKPQGPRGGWVEFGSAVDVCGEWLREQVPGVALIGLTCRVSAD